MLSCFDVNMSCELHLHVLMTKYAYEHDEIHGHTLHGFGIRYWHCCFAKGAPIHPDLAGRLEKWRVILRCSRPKHESYDVMCIAFIHMHYDVLLLR